MFIDYFAELRVFQNLILACYQFVADIPSGKIEGFSETVSAGLPTFLQDGADAGDETLSLHLKEISLFLV